MNKKRIATIILAASLTIGLVGGSLAWFTSSDVVNNKFASLQDDENKGGAGIDIWENFDRDGAGQLLPGSAKVNKYVQVQNTAKYNQLIRVKITPKWLQNDIPNANPADILLDFGSNLGVTDGKWFKEGDWYYYLGKVSATKFTGTLLEKVSLSSALGNAYKNAIFDVKVEAESVQANKGNDEIAAPYNEWSLVPGGIVETKFKSLVTEDKFNGVNDVTALNGVTATGTTTEYSYN
jgi:predicted ribosomally synthesized peptide with SipW-like signal peptide